MRQGQGAEGMRRHTPPCHLHLEHGADEFLDLGTAGGVARLGHLAPAGHYDLIVLDQ